MPTTTLPILTAERSWAPDERTPASARAAVRRLLRAWGVDEESIADAVLLTSEVVTNAVVHAGSTIDTVVRLSAGHLRVEVSDGDPHPPVRCHPARTDENYRGIALVEAYAHDWGTDPAPSGTGKTVWWCQYVEE
jgi:anti-sigma regulatory factor (Ser/Thr protein kinase)